MRYVIDSSVAFKWVVPEPYSDKARQLRADYENAVHDLLAPNVFPIEVGHALTRAERQKRIPVGSAVPLLTERPSHPAETACFVGAPSARL